MPVSSTFSSTSTDTFPNARVKKQFHKNSNCFCSRSEQIFSIVLEKRNKEKNPQQKEEKIEILTDFPLVVEEVSDEESIERWNLWVSMVGIEIQLEVLALVFLQVIYSSDSSNFPLEVVVMVVLRLVKAFEKDCDCEFGLGMEEVYFVGVKRFE